MILGSSSGGSGMATTTTTVTQHQNAGGGGGHTRRGGPGKQVDTNATVYQFRIEERQRISLSKESRAVRTLTIIWITFVVCWVPFFIMYIIGAFCEECFSSITVHMLTWLGYINSALNPLIYTIFNEDYRKAFRKLLCILPDPDDAAARARSSRTQNRAAPSLQPLSSAE
ncbi:hypothetical protein QAD02_023005 [Eretmocerus hayati]|uniref:Uncharacterized protein n=1 Tax=Eretmocerus hayati TaxID=131215 RepID=A0ACC2PW97_9HYME|nr:hypothetical protein QAD02_023005 [Eretmocerus hayati]